MIDIESQVFTKVATALRSAYTGIHCESKTVYMPSVFPCVCLEESDNYSYKRSRSSAGNEQAVIVMYEANIYSSLVTGAKEQVKSILSTLDTEMENMGFTRTMKQPIANEEQPITYRMVARYEAVVDKNQKIYRR